MTVQHSLLYFNGAGRAEAIRICLFAANVDFEDKRFSFPEFKDIKPTTPLGAVPVLTIDGVEYVQSTALLRYAGRLAGWYPLDNPLDALVVDQALETLNELASKVPRASNPQQLYELRTAFQENEMTRYATFLESSIQRNGGGPGFLSGGTISVADLSLYLTVQMVSKGNLDHVEMNFFEKYPGILATSKMVEQHEKVQAYYQAKKEKEVESK